MLIPYCHCFCMQLLILASMLVAVGVASWASLHHTAYDEAAPKRLLIQHAHLHAGSSLTESKLLVGGSDAVDVTKAIDASAYQQRNASYRDWQVGPHERSLRDVEERSPCHCRPHVLLADDVSSHKPAWRNCNGRSGCPRTVPGAAARHSV